MRATDGRPSISTHSECFAQAKRFWALNKALSKIPKVFWREIISGTFTVVTGILAYHQLNKSINHINAGL